MRKVEQEANVVQECGVRNHEEEVRVSTVAQGIVLDKVSFWAEKLKFRARYRFGQGKVPNKESFRVVKLKSRHRFRRDSNESPKQGIVLDKKMHTEVTGEGRRCRRRRK